MARLVVILTISGLTVCCAILMLLLEHTYITMCSSFIPFILIFIVLSCAILFIHPSVSSLVICVVVQVITDADVDGQQLQYSV